MSAIILNMEQYRKPNMFFIKNGLSLFQNKQISILEIGFGTGWMHLLLLEGKKWINQSITSGGSLSGFRGRTGFHELRRRIECFESQGIFLIKCIKVMGRKENLGDDFINKKGSNCLKRLMIWTGSIWFILMLSVIVELWSTAIFKKCMMHSKQWRTSYLCCSWCS
jgi:hypothetical protein